MVPVQGGTFQMGSTQHALERPIRDVTVSGFQIQDKPTTNRQWNAYLEAGQNQRYGTFLFGSDGQVQKIVRGHSETAVEIAAALTGLSAGGYYSPVMELLPTAEAFQERFSDFKNGGAAFLGEDHPVVMVNLFEAYGFTDWIGKRLPTEAEWEYAARAGREDDEVFGTASGSQETLHIEAHWRGNKQTTNDATLAVGQFEPNPFGLYDMSGNVWEWVGDRWQDNYQGLAEKDPIGPATGHCYSLRGGSWVYDNPALLRAALRAKYRPVNRYHDFGFRVVASQDSQK